ncbi:MAG: NAD(P)H-binding protein [Planctomycetota bacterium]
MVQTQGDQSGMTVAVTGASGFVGRYVVRELLSRGHRVRGLTRSHEKAREKLPTDDERLTIVAGDALESGVLDALYDGADAGVHLIGIIREAPGGQTFRKVHVETTKAVLKAAKKAGAKRHVQMSAIGADVEGKTEYWRTKGGIERMVRGSGLDWTIFRPGLIHGPDSEMMQMAKGWVTGRSMPWVVLPYFTRLAEWPPPLLPPAPPKLVGPEIEPVHVSDVANAFVTALGCKASIGEIYHLCGPERMTWPELLTFVRDRVPTARKWLRPVGLPQPIGQAQAVAWMLSGLKHAMPFDYGMATMAGQDVVADTTKARRDLGMRFESFSETAAEYVPTM